MQRNLGYKIALFVFMLGFIFAGVVFAAGFTAFTGQINVDDINVRVDATISSMVVCTLFKGELVEVILEVYDWYKIRLPKEAPSYVKKDLVECINNISVKCSSAKVIADRVNIRLGPSESSWIIGKVDNLTVVNIIQGEGSWYKIEPVHQSYGWVNKKFINKSIVVFKKDEKPIIALQPVALATAQRRVPADPIRPGAAQRRVPADPIRPGAGGQTTILQSVSQESEQMVVEGMVSPYGVVLWRKATHKLVTDRNEVYFLKGNRKGLDSLNYRKVKVTGKLISPKNSRYPIIEVAIIEVLN